MPNAESTLPAVAALRFGPALRFELQPAERRLLVDGQPAALGRRALDLLTVLAERPDRLLTKHELLDRVWPGLVVEEANLQVQISNLRKVLGGELIATVPGRGYRFAAPVGQAAAVDPAVAADAAAPGRLAGAAVPAPAEARDGHGQGLIGRAPDLARLEDLLRQGGCVTLVGTAGVGKTRLARAAAARWPGRQAWVDLADLVQGRQVAGALARALGLQLSGADADAPGQIAAALATLPQPLLLVLDNAEHLLDACAALTTRLAPLPGLQWLVTSQVPLAVNGEQLMRLEPLALPNADADGGPDDGALSLLIDRITAADHRFTVTAAQLPLLRAVCTQLDGLPLALEMAAARVPLLGLQGVHDALAQRFALLTRGHRNAAVRHRTLHNALDWSYRLLSPAEQWLFRALGVFAGGFTLELAMALMTDDAQARWEVIDGLSTLADRSLVAVGAGDPPRYRLLESTRAFALEQLAEAGEAEATRGRHADAVLALFARHVVGNSTTQALCVAEMDNAREAIAWARDHRLGTAAQLSAQVALVTTFTVWRHESGQWLQALAPLMAQDTGLALPAPVQAAWWTEFARCAAIRREATAPAAAQRAMALWRPLAQPRQLLRATLTWVRSIAAAGAELDAACAELQAQVAAAPELPLYERFAVQGALTRADVIRGDLVAVLAGREAEAELARQLGNPDFIDVVESSIVNTLVGLARHAEAAERGQALLARLDADGSGRNGNLPWALGALFGALLSLGRLGEARALLPQLLAAGKRFATPTAFPLLCQLAAAERRFEAAARLLGCARQRYEAAAMTFEHQEAAGLQRVLAAATAALGSEVVPALVQQGRTLDDDAAQALARGESG